MKKLLLLLSFICFIPINNLMAQGCSMCAKTAGQLGEKGADGLNNGIIYLALLPLTFMGIIGYIWWRNNRSANS